MTYPGFASPLQLMLLQNLPDIALLVFDADMRYHLAEGTELGLWSLPTAAVVGQSLGDIFPQDHSEQFEPLYRQVFAGETVVEECRLFQLTYRVKLFGLPEANGEIRFGAAIYQNITVQDQLVSVLHNQEYRFERLFEQTNDAIFILDTEGRHVDANQRALEMFGYSLRELLNMKYEKLVEPGEITHSTGILRGMLGGAVYPVYERTFIKKDGTKLIAEVNTALVQAHEGSPMYIQSVVRDITQRKLTEARLRESEQRYRILTEMISDFAYAFRIEDNGKRVMEWITEDSYQRITGYRSDETHPQGNLLLWHPDDVALIRTHRNRVLAGEAVTDEYRLVTKQGDVRWMRVYRRPVWDEHQQRVVRFYGIAQDITDRKLAEEALRESEERYRSLTELISDYAFSFGVRDDLTMQLEWVTAEPFRRLTGHSIAETYEIGPTTLYHPDEHERVKQDLQTVALGKPVTGDYRIITSDGQERWLQIHRRPVWDAKHERVIRFYGVAQDITERKLAEEALRESEERYRSLTELISDYAFAFRVHPDYTMKLEWVTWESFLRLTGYNQDETRQMDETALYHPDHHAQVLDDLQIVLHGKPVTGEYRIITKAGQERWLQIHRRPVWDVRQQRVIRFYGVAQDITERKLAEEALRESEARYRNLSELISDYAFSVRVHPDLRTEMEWITGESFQRLTGYNETETRELNQGALFHTDDREKMQEDVRIVSEGKAVTGEYRIVTKAGEERWLQIHRRPVWDVRHQRVTRYYGIAQDITERKLAENALRASEERYRTITELISDYAFSATVSGNRPDIHFEWITEDSLMRITGYTVEEFTSKSIAHPDDVQRLLQELAAASRGQSNSSVFRIITKWGDTRWLRLDRYPVWDKDFTKVLRFYGIAHDITEIKQAEDAQKRSEERFRLISQSTLDGLYDIDLLAEQTWLSDGYMRLFKLTSIPANMMDWWQGRIHPDDRDMVHQKINQLITGNLSHWSAEYRIYDMHEKLIYISDRGHVIPDETGRAERLIGAVTDVTQQREIEQRRLDVTVEREKLKIFTDFITAISHDFRNPLSILNTSIYLLEKVDNPEDRQRHLAKLKYETAHIEMLVDGLLTMSQLDSPEAFTFSPLNVNDLLYYVEVREQNSFDQHQLTLYVQPGDDLPRVQVDLNWLYRALRNLIANARLYTPEGGEVTISTYVDDETVVIAVTDTGIGIAPEHLPQIFDPLYRVESHRPSSGQGLGLSIARKIVERHNGIISVESTLDEGSTFRIHLPIFVPEANIQLD